MLHIIINPSSSSGNGLKQWEKLEQLFLEAGAEYAVHLTGPDNRIEKICEELTSRGEETTIVLLGGDGSMNAAVNGIRDFASTKIGFIPVGSGNDLALDLGLSKDPRDLVRTIVRGEVVRGSDIGRVTFHNRSELVDPITYRPLPPDADVDAIPSYRLFNISAGIGFDAACCQEAETSSLKKVLNKLHLGKLVYLAAAIHLILTAPMQPAKITVRSGSFEDPASAGDVKMAKKESRIIRHLLFAVCMNHRYEGGGFKFCPSASDSDSLLDTCIAGDLNRLHFFHIFPTAYSGNHLRYKGVDGGRAASCTIQTKIPLWVHTDGEVSCKSSCITLDVLPEKLRMIV